MTKFVVHGDLTSSPFLFDSPLEKSENNPCPLQYCNADQKGDVSIHHVNPNRDVTMVWMWD